MISFIIIGRNEGWKISKSIQSIFDTIEKNALGNFEIIYVDSDSGDDSIERAGRFKGIKIIKLSGELNAGIARNVGVKNSKGNVLFFIDGDMEIDPDFLSKVYSKENGLISEFVSSNWINYFYNESGELLRKEKFREMKEDKYEKVTGGFFLINKKSWDIVTGFNERFKISEDYDLGLRLAKNGVFLLRKKDMGFLHHTIDYFDKKRMWKDFFNMDHLYGRSLLYRTHLFNRHMYQRLLRFDYTLLLLITSILLFFWFPFVALFCFLIYLITLIFRSKFSFENFIFYLLRDCTVLIGFFGFFPKKNKFTEKTINVDFSND